MFSGDLWQLIHGIPTKKGHQVNKKLKILSREEWHQQFLTKNGVELFSLRFNKQFMDFIYNTDIEMVLKDKEKRHEFQEYLKPLIKDQK